MIQQFVLMFNQQLISFTTILTYYTANPSATRPIVNEGIWTDPTKGPVSANRHRDGANLISANKFEIIDRANAEISTVS